MGFLAGDEMKKAHLLVIPIPNHGHVIPTLRLSVELARKGITITMVLYEDLLAALSSKGVLSELQSLDIRFVGLDNPSEPSRDIPVEDARNLEQSFKPVLGQLLQDKGSGSAGGPTSILSDMFLFWAKGMAEALEIPWYVFFPCGASLARVNQECIWLFAQDQLRIEPDGKLKKFDGTLNIPGLPPLRYHELVFSLRTSPRTFLTRSEVMCQADGVVVNTAHYLEGKVIESMIGPGHPGFEEDKVRKIYPVGPLFSNLVNLRSIAVTKGLEDSADESILWLNSQPRSCVLYVAFGTIAQLSAAEIHELALGLESSSQRFLWVLPQRKGSPEVDTRPMIEMLPTGFLARVGDRGHIVRGWAPQLQILAHSATRAFLTHAGWNSCMESITFGVPMICWPQGAEQHINCRYVVDELKIADQLQTGPENVLDWREVERAVRVLMAEPEGEEMRGRVMDLKKKAAEAVAEDGSMSRAIGEFALDVSVPQDPKKSVELGQ